MEPRRAPKKLDASGLWEYALRILAQRAHSSAELKQKLSRRAASSAEVSSVLAKLREYDMTDDRKFSETFATSRLQNQGFGRMRVLRDLQSKRVAGSIARNAVEKAFEGIDETDLAQRFLERKFRNRKLAAEFEDPKRLASAYRRLRTAGFTPHASLQALKRFSNKMDELPEPSEEEEPPAE